MSQTIRLVVPMKPLAYSKLRLSEVLPASKRQTLVLWMLQRVLGAAIASATGPVCVVGGDPSVAGVVSATGAHWEADTHRGLNATLQAAHAKAGMDGSAGLLFLPADLPLLNSGDVVLMATAFDGSNVVLAPGRRGGTNAILAARASGFQYRLGDDSFRLHAEALERNGSPWRRIDSPSIAADIDLPEDLTALESQLPDLWDQVATLDCCFDQPAAPAPSQQRR